MKLGTTTLILGVALTVVAGLFGAASFGLIETNNVSKASTTTTGLITGHVTTIHKDSAGNVVGYRQSDNLIVNGGENCTLKMLFAAAGGAAGGNNVCTGANTAGYRWIAIGNTTSSYIAGNTPGAPLPTDTNLGNPYNSTAANAGMARKFGNVGLSGWSNSTGSTNAGTATVVMSATFTNNAVGARVVNESGLFNMTDGGSNHQTDGMFAKQVFSGISLNANDSLTVQWTINVGGTSTFGTGGS
ncbi:hypothetical protein [Candidatus Nitrosotenuis cloacae]|uniref:Uncharacterized protein n=1 Tax=Candidatus Nitrosotenuis cloacae TaxID=1603555 RepID=A0A3G1B7K1_9ARCH|nr:hypothetical protein [Candidatus Nitrosotenuis cloacae]AJZ76085.1 hypothetical protein SU86_006540 [Candidatus Nitrosotenuis cloacae]